MDVNYKDLPQRIIPPSGKKYGDSGWDLDYQPKYNIPDKIMIACHVTGQPLKRAKNPNQPYTPDEIRKSAFDCIEAGAAYIHVHARTNEGDIIMDKKEHIKRLHQIIDPIREKYGYSVFIDGCLCIDTTFENEMLLINEGLTELVPINPGVLTPPSLLQAEASYLNGKNIPIGLGLHSETTIDEVREYLIKPGFIKLPMHWGLLPNMTVGQTLLDELEMAEYVIRMIRRIRKIDPGAIISLPTAGRASYYLATMGIIMGLQLRVGVEDTYFKWPHKDDKLESTVAAFKSMRIIAENLGRTVMTANEYRTLLGIPTR